MEILSNYPLKAYTTFKIGGPARYFTELRTPSELTEALEFADSKELQIFILGGGSNLLISDRGLDALVLHPCRTGLRVEESSNGQQVRLQVQAAEPWDRLVAYAVKNNFWGIENLSHIPGQAGAAAVQNIGAYGQQISDVLQDVLVAELRTGATSRLSASECGLAYRKSIFNSTQKRRYLILEINLRLTRDPRPNLGYAAVKLWFERLGTGEPSLLQIREAIVAIRDAKFPYPRTEKGGNAGSFFKNLMLTQEDYEALEQRFRDDFNGEWLTRLRELRRLSTSSQIRMPTAFLIEACGLKGHRMGGAVVNERQPLVLLNEGGASARDVLLLARHIRQTIFAATGLKISIEPELAGFTPSELTEDEEW